MSREVLLKARSHFRAARTVESLHRIDVPEWETEIYYWPEMSVEERKAVYGHIKASEERTFADLTAAALTQVLLRARDAHGTRMFMDTDAAALADADPKVLERISGEMGFGSQVSVEAAEKN